MILDTEKNEDEDNLMPPKKDKMNFRLESLQYEGGDKDPDPYDSRNAT